LPKLIFSVMSLIRQVGLFLPHFPAINFLEMQV
jgi:hypothetical protein